MPAVGILTRKESGGIDEFTKLMLHMDGDFSGSGHNVTTLGDPTFDNVIKKFNSSIDFDGSGDYVSLLDSDDWYAVADWTCDFWFRPGVLSNSTNYYLWDQGDGAGTISFGAWIEVDGIGNKQISWRQVTASTQDWRVDTGTITLNVDTWYHVAFVRNGNDWRIYLDGVSQGNTTSSTVSNLGAGFYIAKAGYSTPQYFNGHVDEFRVSDMARWTTGFTPPSSEYTSDANTKLLIHFDGDASDSNHDVTMKKDPIFNNTIYKFAPSSLEFDGSGDYISIPDSPDWNYGTDDFTVDTWIRLSSLDTSMQIYYQFENVNNRGGLSFSFTDGGKLTFAYLVSGSGQGYYMESAGGVFLINTWYHVAIVRNGNNFVMYIDGISADTATSSDAVPDLSAPLHIGEYDGGGIGWYGHIDEFRISNTARWTTDFTPNTGPYT